MELDCTDEAQDAKLTASSLEKTMPTKVKELTKKYNIEDTEQRDVPFRIFTFHMDPHRKEKQPESYFSFLCLGYN